MNRFTPEDLLAKGYVSVDGSWLKMSAKAPIPPAMPKATPKRSNEPTAPQKGRLRQNTTGLNKTEAAFYEYLKTTKPGARTYAQVFTIKVANGCRYTPDFVLVEDCIANDAFYFSAYEVKGFMRDDAAVKLKVAASIYPWIKFHLVTRKKGEWLIQEILP